MIIREALETDRDDVLAVEMSVFGPGEVPDLVRDLLDDKSRGPVHSLIAVKGPRPVGHVLFTAARLEPAAPVVISILAPLAVIPDFRRRG